MENLTVATALQNVELINLKIAEKKRQSAIAADKFKNENPDKPDLRKCSEWVSIQVMINELIVTKRTVVEETTLFS